MTGLFFYGEMGELPARFIIGRASKSINDFATRGAQMILPRLISTEVAKRLSDKTIFDPKELNKAGFTAQDLHEGISEYLQSKIAEAYYKEKQDERRAWVPPSAKQTVSFDESIKILKADSRIHLNLRTKDITNNSVKKNAIDILTHHKSTHPHQMSQSQPSLHPDADWENAVERFHRFVDEPYFGIVVFPVTNTYGHPLVLIKFQYFPMDPKHKSNWAYTFEFQEKDSVDSLLRQIGNQGSEDHTALTLWRSGSRTRFLLGCYQTNDPKQVIQKVNILSGTRQNIPTALLDECVRLRDEPRHGKPTSLFLDFTAPKFKTRFEKAH